MTKAVVCVSGGMDSFTVLHYALQKYGPTNVSALSFNYNQRHKKELIYAAGVCSRLSVEHHVVDLQSLNPLLGGSSLTRPEIEVPEGHYEHESMKITVVPGRNTIMLAIAMGHAQSIGASVVLAGTHEGDHAIYPDCRGVYIDTMDEVFRLATEDAVYLYTPFQYTDKPGILRYGLEHLGLKPDDYGMTWTCYRGLEEPCGKCGACQERALAFSENNVPDPLAPPTVHTGTGKIAGAGKPNAV